MRWMLRSGGWAMTEQPFYRPPACVRGKHEMNLEAPIDVNQRDKDGNIVWVRVCAWCGQREIVSQAGDPR